MDIIQKLKGQWLVMAMDANQVMEIDKLVHGTVLLRSREMSLRLIGEISDDQTMREDGNPIAPKPMEHRIKKF
jgi:hypothetical protein